MPQGFPYGLPGYGTSAMSTFSTTTAIPTTTAPHTTLPAAPPPSTSLAPSTGVPIHLLKFPPSPSPLHNFPLPPVPFFSTYTTVPPLPAPTPAAPSPGLGIPRFSKLDFTSNDGSEDPLNWLTHYKQFFRGQRTLALDRVWLAPYHLRGAAQTSYDALEQDEGVPSLERFKDLCHLRFGPPVRCNRLSELAWFPFHTTVEDYHEHFNALVCHNPNLEPRQKADLFMGGLLEHIHVDVELRAPKDLQTAMHQARAYERRAVAMLPAPAANFLVDDPTDNGAADAAVEPALWDEQPVSLYTLAGIRTEETMHLHVYIQGHKLLALLDSGSTHNFINARVMCHIRLVTGDSHMRVTMANGNNVTCTGMARNVAMRFGKEDFTISCFGIDLGGFDLILGVDYLRTLGPILWDFEDLCMSFRQSDRCILWKGMGSPRDDIVEPALLAMMGDHQRPLLDKLLHQYGAIFDEPRGLHPAPPTTTTYTLLLVKKVDGSWHFYIDYRALNDKTSKDKFPIPVVDELLDELHGTRFFAKLDLRSGYHQVRMHPEDIEKMAFHTHHGHFEFLVMPFGLSNVPATFQVLMNDVLWPFLRRFVLVFFDNILIYGSSWSEHLQHVRLIFDALRAHGTFEAPSVTYLGHVISADGVAMDGDKVDTVASWLEPRSPRGVRGFLGLSGYYQKFIQDFGTIAAPLTRLLCKEAFAWTPEAAEAFSALNHALSSGPVL
ncbi:uncharacterized protein [Miscanthus floridulus]|uniref:uncharacterized protein n=1 Tax=Miscanthus floridulus TaxID=154761 RepID=UPI0034597198